MKYWLMAVSSAVRMSLSRVTTWSCPFIDPPREDVGGLCAPTIVPVTGPFHQRVQEIAAGAAVAAGAARALDLGDRACAVGDGRLDSAIGDAAAEAEDHPRGLRERAGRSIIRVPFGSLLGP
jgi:hypothetical protein